MYLGQFYGDVFQQCRMKLFLSTETMNYGHSLAAGIVTAAIVKVTGVPEK